MDQNLEAPEPVEQAASTLQIFRTRLSYYWRHPRTKLALRIGAGLAAASFVILLIFYFKYARMIDRRLADGPFATATSIYTSPRLVAVGDGMSPDQVVHRLRRSGYTTTRDNPAGWFKEAAGAIEIVPGPESFAAAEPVRIEFAKDKISRITGLRDRASRKDYLLDPQLIANVSEGREKRVLVRYKDIPKNLVHALVSVEDKRFFRHSGFDPLRILKAAYVDVRDGRKQQGASTLSMQLTRSLWLDPGKRWQRKFQELLITLHIEQKLTKEQIFEYYANEVYLGRFGTFNIHGFGEGSRVFFGKDLTQINAAEAALLAGLVQRPSYFNPVRYPERARERRDVVLGLMVQNKYMSNADYERAIAAPVQIAAATIDASATPYFTALMQDELQIKLADNHKRIRSVATTIDADLQSAAEEAVRVGMQSVDKLLRNRKREAGDQAMPQVALVAVDPRTGEIKALVGGRDYRTSQLNHAVAQRQPGSVFKPFVYTAAIATAIEGGQQMFTPATLIDDSATTFTYGKQQIYQPGNFHNNYMGEVTLRTALAHSLNNATVSIAQQVGLRKVVAVAQRAGLNRVQATPSAALGSYEATPIEIAGAYTMFANGGVRVTPTTISSVRASDGTLVYRHTPDTRAALDSRVNYVMVDMLQEVMRSGTAAGVRGRGFSQPAGGKTGTSRDGWFAGFTTELVCVVWVGYDDNRELNLEGSKSALPIWAEFMKRAAQFRPYRNAKEFSAPSGISSEEICKESGLRAGAACPNVRMERFIAGTEPAASCDLHSYGRPIAVSLPTPEPQLAQPVSLRGQ